MDELELADRFDRERPRLRAVAYRMLGSLSEADDAVQEAWLRLQRTDADEIDNLEGWLTTVVARICLNVLRARSTRSEQPLDGFVPEPIVSPATGDDPEHEALLADAVGVALQVVLDTLAPAERVAFVLHDMFAVPFDEIATLLDRSPAGDPPARQPGATTRAGRRASAGSRHARQRTVVDAFFAAARDGDLEALVAVLDPDVVVRAHGRERATDRAARRRAGRARRRCGSAASRRSSGRR